MLTVVRHKSGTVAIDVHLIFEHAIEKHISVSALSLAKLIGDYFDIRRCGSNNTFLLIMRQVDV
jgi:hypothetical protein